MTQIQSILGQLDREEVELVFTRCNKDSLEVLNEVLLFLKSRGRYNFIGNAEDICKEIIPLVLDSISHCGDK